MSAKAELAQHIADMLEPFGQVAVKRMFGSHGLFKSDIIFAILHDETLYFRTDEHNLAEYEEAGSEAFVVHSGRLELPYRRVPEAVMDEPEELCAWAGRAFEAALRSAKRKTEKKRTRIKANAAARLPNERE
jgi:DNA transformation protein